MIIDLIVNDIYLMFKLVMKYMGVDVGYVKKLMSYLIFEMEVGVMVIYEKYFKN